MLFVLTNSLDATADYLCAELRNQGTSVVRFDTDQCDDNLSVEFDGRTVYMHVGGRRVTTAEVTMIWYRRPDKLAIGSDLLPGEQNHLRLEWSAAVEGFLAHVPFKKWCNHPSRNVMAGNKIEQIGRARDNELCVPDTILTCKRDVFRRFWQKHSGQIICKPLVSGYIERADPNEDTVIYANEVPASALEEQESVLERCPTLFQKLISKKADVRISYLDGRMQSVAMTNRNIRSDVDIRRDNMRDVAYSRIELPQEIHCKLSNLVRSYNLRFAAIDMVIDKEGQWHFLEINPNGQWAWLDLNGVTCFAQEFNESLKTSALIN